MKNFEQNLKVEKSKNSSLWSLFKEWCESSSSHGIPNMARSNNYFIFGIWALCFCGSSSFCFWLILQSINQYLDRPVSTNVKVINEVPSLFPSVSFCNLNPINSDNPSIVMRLWGIAQKINMTEYSVLPAYEKKKAISYFINSHISSLNDTEKKT